VAPAHDSVTAAHCNILQRKLALAVTDGVCQLTFTDSKQSKFAAGVEWGFLYTSFRCESRRKVVEEETSNDDRRYHGI